MAHSDEQLVDIGPAQLCAQTFGDPRYPAILLIAGAHSPMDWWDERFCRLLAGGGRRFVIRYDHRDTGRSTTYPPGRPDYGFADLAADALVLLDRLEIDRAHLVGVSMGGGIAQRIALAQPDRVITQALVATSPGLRPAARTDRDLPMMTPALLEHFRKPPPPPRRGDRDAAIRALVAAQRRLAGTGLFEEARVRRLAARIVDRSVDVAAMQINHGMIDPGDRYRERLASTTAPTLVIHGRLDPLFPFGHAEALVREIPGARLFPLESVGHQVPPKATWAAVIPALLSHTQREP